MIPSSSKPQGLVRSDHNEEPTLELWARPAKRVRVNEVEGVPFLKEVTTEVDDVEVNGSRKEGGSNPQIFTTYIVELTEEELQALIEPS